ncbi:MAG: HAMP domain-containing protein [Chromatiales bacterium]
MIGQTGIQEIGQLLDSNLEQVSQSVADSERDTRDSLTRYLSSSMQGELKVTEAALHESLMETADALANMLSAVAPEAILSKNYSTLMSYVKVANRNPRVVYAVYMRPEGGRPFTRYVNRKNPLVNALIEKGEGRTPLDKLFSAAAGDANINQIVRPVQFEGKQLGSVLLGVSMESMNARVAEMQSRFDKLILDSEVKVQESLQQVAQTINQSLQSNFALVSRQSSESSEQAQSQIDVTANSLVWTQVGTMAVIGFLILLALCGFFMLRIVSPLSRANEIARGIASGDLNQKVDIIGRDEIGQLGESMSVMIANLKQDIEATHKQADEAVRIRTALDNVSSSVMMADNQRRIFYLNKAAQQLFQETEPDIRKDLPNFDSANLVGGSIDDFHRHPEHQIQLLENLEATHRSELEIGGRRMRIVANPVINENGERLGTAVEWTDRTAEVAVEIEVENIVSAAQQANQLATNARAKARSRGAMWSTALCRPWMPFIPPARRFPRSSGCSTRSPFKPTGWP